MNKLHTYSLGVLQGWLFCIYVSSHPHSHGIIDEEAAVFRLHNCVLRFIVLLELRFFSSVNYLRTLLFSGFQALASTSVIFIKHCGE